MYVNFTFRTRLARLFMRIALVIIAIIALFPIYWIFATSLETSKRAFSFPGALIPQGTLQNFIGAWKLAPWLQLLLNSFIVGAATTIGTLIVGFMAAYALVYLLGRRSSKLVFGTVLLTMMVPFYAVIIPDYIIMRDVNLLNTYAAQVLPFIGGGFAIFLFRQFILGFPTEYRDAARTDGLGNWGYMWRILFPNLKPAFVTIGIYTFILSWNSFLWPLIVTTDSSVQPIQVGLQGVVTTANGTDFTLLAAAAAITAIPVIILYAIFQRQVTDSVANVGLK